MSKQKLKAEWQANLGGDVRWFLRFRFQWNGATFNTNEMILALWSYKATFGEIKGVTIHQMMNCICQCSNNCFIALLKTMGDCDLWAGRQTCSTTNIGRSPLFFFVSGNFSLVAEWDSACENICMSSAALEEKKSSLRRVLTVCCVCGLCRETRIFQSS